MYPRSTLSIRWCPLILRWRLLSFIFLIDQGWIHCSTNTVTFIGEHTTEYHFQLKDQSLSPHIYVAQFSKASLKKAYQSAGFVPQQTHTSSRNKATKQHSLQKTFFAWKSKFPWCRLHFSCTQMWVVLHAASMLPAVTTCFGVQHWPTAPLCSIMWLTALRSAQLKYSFHSILDLILVLTATNA